MFPLQFDWRSFFFFIFLLFLLNIFKLCKGGIGLKCDRNSNFGIDGGIVWFLSCESSSGGGGFFFFFFFTLFQYLGLFVDSNGNFSINCNLKFENCLSRSNDNKCGHGGGIFIYSGENSLINFTKLVLPFLLLFFFLLMLFSLSIYL
jgi:hypothetical protein